MTKGDRDKLRAELAGKVAAAIVSTIRNEEDYCRYSNLGCELGLSVSEWIAKDSVKQADALMREMGLSLDKEDHPAYDPS